MTIEWIITISTTLIIVFAHDLVLKWINSRCNTLKMVWVMLILSLSHVLHIWVYAFALYISVNWVKSGEIIGCTCKTIHDYVYFSASNYTSLGYGDYVATDGLRLLATFEGLIGLLMIGWSTAFAFWWMQRNWLNIDNKAN